MSQRVSIITPTFNSAPFISATILSVQNQTYPDWEMLIVDDCSTDETVAIVKTFAEQDNRIRFYELDRNSGAGVARNHALEKASGRYIAFLDADDLWKPEKLEKQLAFLAQNKLPFTFSFYDCIDENGDSLQKRIKAPLRLSYRQLFFCNFIGNLTGIYDTDYFGKIPIASFRKRQDWIVWLTILKKIKTAQPVPESLALYRIRKDSISASKRSLLQHNYRIYRDFHGKSNIGAFFCMIGFLFTQLLIKPRFIEKL
ncbi:glycosyltransferase family 2 protein [Flavobacterium sp.]|uniref:glycosyltransferase family 2 protein n=1 Tax=Flavobacterium sp. TaxID=239 RepID=UPI002611484E|nr:glycosyltransferase family 2 protein [Flavobacterium sp.]